MPTTIKIATDFSKVPGGRFRKNGPWSGEEFREKLLLPAVARAIETGDTVTVVLDDTAGYASSFLEEAFGGLVRSGISKDSARSALRIVASDARYKTYQRLATEYFEGALASVH